MRAVYDFTDVDPVPVGPRGFNFKAQLLSGDAIVVSAVEILIHDGNDSNPTALLIGATSVQGSVVWQTLGTPIAGVTYNLRATVTTNLGHTYQLNAHLTCRTLT